MVYCDPVPVLVEVDFHSQSRDLLGYDRKSFVLLLQLAIAPYALVLTFALSESDFLNCFLMGRSTIGRHLSYVRPSDDGITMWW